MEVNASGRPVRELSREPAVPGRDITTTLDLGLQETVMRRLSAERQAAAVVVNVENGDILALASTPSFDPNAFVGGLSAQAWKRSEEHTSELQSLMRISYAVFCMQK